MKKNIAICLVFLFTLGSIEVYAAKKKPPQRPSFTINQEIIKLETKEKRKLDEYERDEIKFNILKKAYKEITKEKNIMLAIELMDDTIAEFSKEAIFGNNITYYPIKVEYKDLSQINPGYANFDALGWKKGAKLHILINEKHKDAPPEALCPLIAHEALHQDEFNSLNEETYAWTYEAAVWEQMTEADPNVVNINHPLVQRENTLKKLFEKGSYTNKYIKKAVYSNEGYKNLPSRSPGFENDDI